MEWRQSIHPCYEVSEYGDLRAKVARGTRPAGYVLKGSYNKHGYRVYGLYDPGVCKRGDKSKKYLAHQLVLYAFVGPRPTDKHQGAHWDGNPSNNHYTNLRWATPAENTADKVRHGRVYEGHKKFTAEQVLDIVNMRNGGAKYADIRAKYKISKGNLSAILNGQTWSQVTGIGSETDDRP